MSQHVTTKIRRRRNILLAAGPALALLAGHWACIFALSLVPGYRNSKFFLVVEFLNPIAMEAFIALDARGSLLLVHFLGLVGSCQWTVLGAVCGAILWMMFRRRPSPRKLCGSCGYDLRGVRSAACPECGRPVPGSLWRKSEESRDPSPS